MCQFVVLPYELRSKPRILDPLQSMAAPAAGRREAEDARELVSVVGLHFVPAEQLGFVLGVANVLRRGISLHFESRYYGRLN